MIVVICADSTDVELIGDHFAFGVSLVVIPSEPFVAAVGINDIDPVKGASIAVVAVLGGYCLWTSRQEFLVELFLCCDASRAEMDVWV